MKIALISDFHFGFGYGTELEADTFINAREAIEKALEKKVDLILICGDLFDSRAPRTPIFAKAMKIISKAILSEGSKLKLISSDREIPKICTRILNATPTIALHGNHERRAKGEINPVEALEAAGLLIHLNFNTLIFEKNGERVAIHGMSNVPERYAENFLKKWNPKPVGGCYNLLALHQSIDPYIFSPLEPPTLKLENLPRDFDLIVSGHVHQAIEDRIGNSKFLITGSTSIIQFERAEAEVQKGFFILDTLLNRLEFIPLGEVRKFFYEEIEIQDGKPFREQVEQRLRRILDWKFRKKPLIRLKIKGKETQVIERDLKEVEKRFAPKAILFLIKELESEEITEKIEFLQNLRELKLSVEEMGLSLLRKNLEELKFSFHLTPERLFKLLEESSEKAMQILLGEQLTLEWLGR